MLLKDNYWTCFTREEAPAEGRQAALWHSDADDQGQRQTGPECIPAGFSSVLLNEGNKFDDLLRDLPSPKVII